MGKRLFLFWPVFTEVADEGGNSTVPTPGLSEPAADVPKTWKKLKLQMAVSDYRQGKWTPKRVSKDTVEWLAIRRRIIRKHYRFFPVDRSEADGRFGICFDGFSVLTSQTVPGADPVQAWLMGAFEISGCTGVPVLGDLAGSFRHAITPEFSSVSGNNTSFLKWVEHRYPQQPARNDFTLLNFSGDALHATPVLMQTPGSLEFLHLGTFLTSTSC